jgi:adenylate kinase
MSPSELRRRAIRPDSIEKPFIIAVSGVPGTGKSEVAEILARNLGAELITITSLLKAGKIPYTWDRARKTKIVSVKDVQKAIDIIIARLYAEAAKDIVIAGHHAKAAKDIVIEGHLAHLLKADATFILRCKPVVLRKRLAKRKWSEKKIEENVQAEMLDIITAEAIDKMIRPARYQKRAVRNLTSPYKSEERAKRTIHKTELYEIDTTRRSPKQTAEEMTKALKNRSFAKKLGVGKINWLV